MKKEKLLATFLSDLMALSLFGCGSSSTAPSSLAAAAKSSEQPTLTEAEINQMYRCR